MSIYTLYRGDQWLSTSSLEIMAVSDSPDKLIELFKNYLLENQTNDPYYDPKINIEPNGYEALSELASTWQTQGLDTNYMLAELEQDKILLI
jgi:hypothetical protein